MLSDPTQVAQLFTDQAFQCGFQLGNSVHIVVSELPCTCPAQYAGMFQKWSCPATACFVQCACSSAQAACATCNVTKHPAAPLLQCYWALMLVVRVMLCWDPKLRSTPRQHQRVLHAVHEVLNADASTTEQVRAGGTGCCPAATCSDAAGVPALQVQSDGCQDRHVACCMMA